MKRKTKRYQDGGKTEDQYKKEGLESSKDEKVGFFERLRMGNIDNPSSEAYRRFGAGRAKMAEEARTPVPESAKESSDYSGRGAKSYSDDGMNVPHSSTPAMDDSEGPSLTERLRKASPGSKISEMDGEGGYTSPVKKATKTAKSATKSSSDKAKTKTEAKPTSRYQDVVKSSELGSQSFSSKTKDEPPKKRGGIGPYGAFAGLTNYLSTLREGRKRPGEMKKGGSVKGYSSGGSTSSASKRADGIAKRGKTRGKVI